MSISQSELDALKQAYYSGVRRFRHGDRETEYRSLEEMRQVIDQAERELSGAKREPYMYSSRGRGYQ